MNSKLQEILLAKTPNQLIQKLKSIDVSVPRRTQGRTTKHTEIWARFQFLRTYLAQGKLAFPIKVIHRDKPDFYFENDKKIIGIECTESIPEQFAWAQALWEKHFPDGIFEPDLFRWDSPKRNQDEILDILTKSQKKLHGPGWYGDGVEKEWSYWMFECIKNKTHKLNNVDFERFEENYLLIYDNLPQANNNQDLSTSLLFEKLFNMWNLSNLTFFSSIFIESSDYLIHITSIGIEPYKIPELSDVIQLFKA